jgi:hypothetical protein
MIFFSGFVLLSAASQEFNHLYLAMVVLGLFDSFLSNSFFFSNVTEDSEN